MEEKKFYFYVRWSTETRDYVNDKIFALIHSYIDSMHNCSENTILLICQQVYGILSNLMSNYNK